MKSLTQKIIILVSIGLLAGLLFVLGSVYPESTVIVADPMLEFFVYVFLASILALFLRPSFYRVWKIGLLVFSIFSVASIVHAPVYCSNGFLLSLVCTKEETAGIYGLIVVAVTGLMLLISIFTFLVNYIRRVD